MQLIIDHVVIISTTQYADASIHSALQWMQMQVKVFNENIAL